MKTVLIVDDEVAIREMLALFLEDEGYEALRATNGTEALAILAARQPVHLVISDVMMPFMDGHELCRQMHAHPVFKAIPFVLMSAALRRLEDDGCTVAAFIDKPFDLDALLKIVQQLIGDVANL